MACIGKTLKVTVIAFNILFFLLGCAILGYGIYLQLKQANYMVSFGDYPLVYHLVYIWTSLVDGYAAIPFILVGISSLVFRSEL